MINFGLKVFFNILCQIKQRDAEQKLEQWKDALKFLDRKLLLIPVSFILLRIWTTILNIVLTYANVSVSNIPTDVSTAFIYLSVSSFKKAIVFMMLMNYSLLVYCVNRALEILDKELLMAYSLF